jgi:DNA-binding NtrC family response regulator
VSARILVVDDDASIRETFERHLGRSGYTVDPDVIVITAYEGMRSTITAVKEGAYDYLVKPLDVDQLDHVLQRCFRDRAARKRSDGPPTQDTLAPATRTSSSAGIRR